MTINRAIIRQIREHADDTISTLAIIKAAAHCGNDIDAIQRRLGLA
jgi:hypothetical protein